MLRIRLLFLLMSLLSGIIVTSCTSKADTQSEENTTSDTSGDLSDRFLDKETFASRIKKGDAVVIDVRMPQEFEQGHIEGAINIDFFNPEFKYQLLELKKNKEYYLYCKNETRSKMTMTFMDNNDFRKVYVLKGGYEDWNKATAQ
jgi:rhodanese-related sulfurtransferase